MPSTQILRHFLILEKLRLCFTSDKSRYHSLRLPRVIIVFLFLRIVLPSAYSRLILVAANKSALTAKELRGKNSDSS